MFGLLDVGCGGCGLIFFSEEGGTEMGNGCKRDMLIRENVMFF